MFWNANTADRMVPAVSTLRRVSSVAGYLDSFLQVDKQKQFRNIHIYNLSHITYFTLQERYSYKIVFL